jgi:class 3 adenylate cyclase
MVADIVGYSRLMGAEEEATLDRLRVLRSELFVPAVQAHGGRVASRAGDGAVVEFRSVVEAVRSALDITRGLAERNASLPSERRIAIRIGIHLGDVIETQDGDLFGDGVNIAARLEGLCAPGGICLSEDAWRQVRDKLAETFVDLGEHQLKNIVRPMRVYGLGGASAVATPGEAASLEPPPRATKAVRPIADVVIGVLKSVEWLKTAHSAEEGAEPAEGPLRARQQPGLAKAVGILETVERIVDAIADRVPAKETAGVDPPEPSRAQIRQDRERDRERRERDRDLRRREREVHREKTRRSRTPERSP